MVETRKRKPACYLRCSSKTQDTDSQRAGIQTYLDGTGQTVPPERWYVDDGVSGGTMDRPALRALNEAIFNGEVDTVIFYDVARFARTFLDGLNELDRWQKAGVQMIFVSQGIIVDPAEWSGQIVLKILLAITLAFSESERERIKSRQKAGLQAAREKTKAAHAMLAQGRSVRATANALGMTEEQVKWCQDHPGCQYYWGNKLRGYRKGAPINEILKLQKAGFGPTEIARILKVGRTTVWERMKDAQAIGATG